MKVSASILSCDFSNLENEFKKINGLVDFIHLDVMDGHFVPNISFGPDIINSIRKLSDIPFESHLMISNPLKYINRFQSSDIIIFHLECDNNPEEVISEIKKMNKKVGISIKPKSHLQDALCALPRMDIAVNHIFRVLQNVTGIVGEYDFNVRAETLVIFDIVHSGERMNGVKAEHFPEAILVKAVLIWIDLLRVHFVHADQMVPHLIRRIGKLHIELFTGHTECPQHDRKTVPAQNRKNDAHILPAEFLADVFGDLLDSRVIPLRPSHDCLRDTEDVSVLQRKSFLFGRFEQAIPDQRNEIISFFENRHNDSSGGYPCVPHLSSLTFF